MEKRETCIKIMEALDEWTDEWGFETSAQMDNEFALQVWYDVIEPQLTKEPKMSTAAIEQTQTDKLFITELINDLHRNGFVRGGKAETMLHDWSGELKKKARVSHPASRLKKTFSKLIGLSNW